MNKQQYQELIQELIQREDQGEIAGFTLYSNGTTIIDGRLRYLQGRWLVVRTEEDYYHTGICNASYQYGTDRYLCTVYDCNVK